MECDSKNDTGNNRGEWNHLKIIQRAPEQHTWKARVQGIKKTAVLGTAHKLWKVLM